MKFINESEIIAKWAPVIEAATTISDKGRLTWMSKMCHVHELFENGLLLENNSYAQLTSVNGMGDTRFPGNPTTQANFRNQTPGSGDKATLLPLAMQVAAQTIGLDLVPVVPMGSPIGIHTYMDYVYAGGKTAGTGTDIPLMVKLNYGTTATPPTFTQGATSATSNGISFSVIGVSRIDGFPILHVRGSLTSGSVLSNAQTILNSGPGIGVGGATGTTGGNAFTIDLVKALEDHVVGFSGDALANLTYTGETFTPYSRLQGETTMDNVMGLQLFNKSVEAKTFQVAAAVTREQVQDLKQFGIDAIAQVESVLINEVTQSINKNIIGRLFELGERNHVKVIRTQGTNFFVNLGATAVTVTASASLNTATAFGSYINDTTLLATTMPATENVNSASENLHTRQRKIMSKILAISNMIATRGRRGPATFVVTNAQVCSALQDCAGFVAAPMANTMNQMGGSLYPVGTLAGLAVYSDPNMAWNDTRFCVGRKGTGDEPGVIFMPYLMAESVQAIVEGTMSPKIAVKSRYALVEAGFFPETMYLTSGVYMGAQFGALV
jgi:hypothetical protein